MRDEGDRPFTGRFLLEGGGFDFAFQRTMQKQVPPTLLLGRRTRLPSTRTLWGIRKALGVRLRDLRLGNFALPSKKLT